MPGRVIESTSERVTESTRARDGALLGWERIGSGPPMLVLHGGGRAGKHYRDLARRVGAAYTVILFDRRGRGLTPSEAVGNLQTIVDDVATILEATGARRVFGHSAGALIALEAARHLAISDIALYEPPLLEAGLPLAWLPEFEGELAAGRPARAMLVMARGLEMGPPRGIPRWIVETGLWLVDRLAGHRRGELLGLLKTIPVEIEAARACRASAYAALPARTLLMHGTESPGFLRAATDMLSKTVPRAEVVALAGQGHNAPDLSGTQAVAGALLAFFGKSGSVAG